MHKIRLAALLVACLALPAGAATLDLSAGVLTYTAATGVANTLSVSRALGFYTIDDPPEAAITLGAGATTAGCVNLDANTVRCPQAAISSWSVSLVDQNDSASLAAVLEPTTIRGGQGNDTLTGGAGPDTFLWNPGDASDTIDGGPGTDTLSFTGANLAEIIEVSAIANGFQLTRNVSSIVLTVQNVESLTMTVLGNDDVVTTQPLASTAQTIDGGTQTTTDTLNYNTGGVCATQGASSFQTIGAQPVNFTGFEAVNLQNQCTVFPVTLDLSAGLVTYTAGTGDVNALSVSLGGGTYTITDTGTPLIALGAGATGAGCASSNATTVTCPRSAISAWSVSLADQSDQANLAAVLEPTTIRGGTGDDTLTGGAGADTFLWNPGDANDTIDGGPGADTLSFTGANLAELIGVSAIPNGFRVTRNVASINLSAINVESLNLLALGNDDMITTQPLASTSQTIDGGTQTTTDTLTYDTGGVCATQGATSFQTLGAQPVTFTGFEAVNLTNQCTVFPGALDLSAGVLAYTAGTGAANALSVSLASGTYTITDTGVPALTLGAGASAAGCANANAVTVTCPRSAISSWNVSLADQSDQANLAAVLEPTTIRGGTGDDTLTGGAGADTFLWNPGDASDFIDGGPGADTLSFNGANVSEILAISAIQNGFQLTRNIANVTLSVFNVEALTLTALGSDDTLTTQPLASTSQNLDGGTQTSADTLTYDAGGACTTQGANTFNTFGAKPVTYSGFEAANVLNQCTTPIPALPEPLRVWLAALLGIATLAAVARKARSG